MAKLVYTNAELMSQIVQDNPAALADRRRFGRALSLRGGTCRRVSLTRTTPDGTVIYYYALFGLVAMMSAEFAALNCRRPSPICRALVRVAVWAVFPRRRR